MKRYEKRKSGFAALDRKIIQENLRIFPERHLFFITKADYLTAMRYRLLLSGQDHALNTGE